MLQLTAQLLEIKYTQSTHSHHHLTDKHRLLEH